MLRSTKCNGSKIFFLRQSACKWEKGTEGETDRQTESQAGSVLSTEPNAGLNPTTLRS